MVGSLYIGSFCASDFGSICATLKDQISNTLSLKISDMANTLDPMDLKQILSLHLDGLSNTVNSYMRLFKASDYSFKELLTFDNAALTSLFPSHTTIDNPRYEELMLYFEGGQ